MFYVCPPKRLQPTPLEPYLRQDPWFEGLIFLFARSDYLRFKRTIFRRLQPVWEKYKGDPGADQLCNLYKRRGGTRALPTLTSTAVLSSATLPEHG